MLESIIIILVMLGILLMIASYVWEDLVISLIDSILWFVCALAVLDVEVPYQYVSAGVVNTATQSVSIPALTGLFIMLGIVMGIGFVIRTVGTLSRK